MHHKIQPLFFLLLSVLLPLSAQEIVKNGYFDQGSLKPWYVPSWLKNTVPATLDNAVMPGAGRASLRFVGAEGKLGMVNQNIRFLKGVRKYQVSLKMKTEKFKNWGYACCYLTSEKTSKSLWVQNVGAGYGTNNSIPWKEYKGEFTVPEAIYKEGCGGTVYLQLQEGNTGTVWFDELSITPWTAPKPAAPKPAAPVVSKIKEAPADLSRAVPSNYSILQPYWENIGWVRGTMLPQENRSDRITAVIPAGGKIALLQRLMSIRPALHGAFRYSALVRITGKSNHSLTITTYPVYTVKADSKDFRAKAVKTENGWTRYTCDFMMPPHTSELRPQIYCYADCGEDVKLEITDLTMMPLVLPDNQVSLYQLKSGGRTGVFLNNQIPQAEMLFKNGTAKTVKLPVKITIADYQGKKVADYVQTLTLPPMMMSRQTVLYPPQNKLGFYAVTHQWEFQGRKYKKESSFTVTTPIEGNPDRVFGITFMCHGREVADTMQYMGAGTKGVRIPWMEMDDGSYDFDGLDRDVEACCRNNLKIIGGFIPVFSDVPGKYLKKAKEREKAGLKPAFDIDYYLSLARFVEAVVTRYKDRIHDWALIGEINLLYTQEPLEYEHYIESTKTISKVLKRVDPKAVLLGIGCSGGDGRALPRFRVMQELWNKLHPYLDGVGLDQYTDPSEYGPGYTPSDSESGMIREIMLEALRIVKTKGKSRISIDEKGPSILFNQGIANPYAVSMGSVVAREYVLVKSIPEIEHWLFYLWRRWREGGTMDSGLFYDEYPRFTVSAYSACARILQNARFVKKPDIHQKTPCYLFRRGSTTVAALWLSGSKDTASMLMTAPREFRLLDVQGNPVKVNRTVDKIELKLSEEPLYLESPLAPEALETLLKKGSISLPEVYAELNMKKFGEVEALVKNMLPRSQNLKLELDGYTADVPFAAGETKIVSLPFKARNAAAAGARPVEVIIRTPQGRRYVFEELFKLTGIAPAADMDALRKAPAFVMNRTTFLNHVDFAANGHWTGPEDCSSETRMGYNRENLLLNIRVRDDIHVNNRSKDLLWAGDSIQFAFDILKDAKIKALKGKRGIFDDDYIFTVALANGKVQLHADFLPADRKNLPASEMPAVQISRNEETKITEYCISVPWNLLTPVKPEKNNIINFSFVNFDCDQADMSARYWMQMTPGIAGGQKPECFRSFVLE